MKTFFFFNFLFISLISNGQINKTQIPNCENFKIGTFDYKFLPAAYSIRVDNKQTSYYPDGMMNEFDIEWTNDCEFILTFIKSSKEQTTYKAGDKLRVVINSIDGNCYVFSAYMNGKEYPPGEMCKMVVKQ